MIVVDNREQDPLTFTRLQSMTGTLYSGDYSIQGLPRPASRSNAKASTTWPTVAWALIVIGSSTSCTG